MHNFIDFSLKRLFGNSELVSFEFFDSVYSIMSCGSLLGGYLAVLQIYQANRNQSTLGHTWILSFTELLQYSILRSKVSIQIGCF